MVAKNSISTKVKMSKTLISITPNAGVIIILQIILTRWRRHTRSLARSLFINRCCSMTAQSEEYFVTSKHYYLNN